MCHMSLSEIAKKTGLPEKTVYYYYHCFEECIPHMAEEENYKFPIEVVDIICTIAQGLYRKMTREELIEELETLYPLSQVEGSSLEHRVHVLEDRAPLKVTNTEEREKSERETKNQDIVFKIRDILKEKKKRRPWWKRVFQG